MTGGKLATRLAHAGRRPEWSHGVVNPPVYHASTCLFETLAELDERVKAPSSGLYYGRRGTPTQWALEAALTELEPGAAGTKLFPSGVAAITAALLAVLKAGDHLLMVDSAYEPTRTLCDRRLSALGIETTYYPPMAGAEIAELFRPNTRALFVESPGSLTFEVQDIPLLAGIAHERDSIVIADNSWATPLLFPALAHGVDLSMQSLTKYVVGHSDAMLGAVTANGATWSRLQAATHQFGFCAGPDDAYLGLRGLRTLGLRLKQHEAGALRVARWLQDQPQVLRVLHPALEDAPGHALWRRDFQGATGLFAILLAPAPRTALAALVDGLAHFGMGFSWGGYESLVLPADPRPLRSADAWIAEGQLLRIHIGLEDPEDLIVDLAAGLARYSAAA